MSNSLSKVDATSELGRRIEAEKYMSTDLKKISDEIGSLLGNVTKVDLNANWTIALKLHEVQGDTEKYMEDGCARLATTHGFDAGRVKAYLAVAEYVDESLINKAMKYNETAKGRYGRITFSHFAALARLDNSDMQKEVFKTIEDDGLSVDQTRQLVSDKIRHADQEAVENGSVKPIKVRPVSVLNQSIKVCSKVAEVMSPVDTNEFMASVLQTINHGTEKQCDKVLELLSNAVESIGILAETVADRQDKLTEFLENVKQTYANRIARESGQVTDEVDDENSSAFGDDGDDYVEEEDVESVLED